MRFANRVTRMLGVDIPIVQAPMGYIAKPRLVAAVAEAGAIGLVPGSLGIEEVRADTRRTRELTGRPFGVNLPLAFVRDLAIVQMIVDEGVQMGTRMVATVESPVHEAMKQAVVDAQETDTMMINQHNGRPVRVLRTETTAPFEHATSGDPMSLLGDILGLYRDGDLTASLAQIGQVAGRIDEVLPVAEIIRRTVEEFRDALVGLADRYLTDAP